jgi:ribosomal-protein-alanine N-acetyltransferase
MSVVERLLRRDSTAVAGPGHVWLAPMHRRDLKRGILEIEEASYPKPWSREVFRSEIEQVRTGTRYYIVARTRDHTLVGYAGLWFAAGDGHVTNVAVHPQARRQGVASTLMLALADRAIERRCAAWTLEVRVSSTGAQDMYRRFGFVPAGVRTRYYENVEDALVMWCHDIQSTGYRDRLDEIRTGRDGNGMR